MRRIQPKMWKPGRPQLPMGSLRPKDVVEQSAVILAAIPIDERHDARRECFASRTGDCPSTRGAHHPPRSNPRALQLPRSLRAICALRPHLYISTSCTSAKAFRCQMG